MSADHQAAISEASSYGKGGSAGRRQAFPGRDGGPDRMWEQISEQIYGCVAFECEESDAVYSWRRPWANGSQPEVPLAPGCSCLVAGRCVHRLLNGSINE